MDNQILKVEYFPSIPRDEITTRSSFQLQISDLSSLGSAFAVVSSEIARVTSSPQSAEGLYRCIFPEGVTGNLATFKEYPGFNLGTIINKNGIAGQARWVPVEAKSAAMSFYPEVIALAVAVFEINRI